MPDGGNTQLFQALRQPAPHTPNLIHRNAVQQDRLLIGGKPRVIEHALIALTPFGDMVCQLRQGFGGCNADTDRQANPLQDALPDSLTIVRQIEVTESDQRQEGLIDGIDFLLRTELPDDPMKPVGQVPV